MTKHLLTRLNAEYKDLEHELKNRLPDEIRRAAALGDLSENAEYEAALDRQRLLQSKLRTLKGRINEVAQIDLDRLPDDKVGYGSIVELLDIDQDSELTYRLVMPEDADAKQKRISISSPIGRSLMGKVVGDEVRIEIPSGTRHFEILELKTYSETEKDL